MAKDATQPKKHKVLKVFLGIIAVIVVLIIIGNATGGSKTNNSNGSSSGDNSGSNSASTPGLNQPADDGKLEFTVTSFTCGQTTLSNDNEFETATAHGQFCVLSMDIKGVGTQSQDFDASSQYIYDNSGTQYSYSSDGTIAANPSDMTQDCWALPTVNPGVTMSCTLAYDVPTGTTPTYAMFHDSSFSGGVKVNLQ